jgi:hypothetical protein
MSNYGQPECRKDLAEYFLLRLGVAANRVVHARRKLHFGKPRLEVARHVSRGASRRVQLHRHHELAVQVIDDRRANPLFDGRDLAKRQRRLAHRWGRGRRVEAAPDPKRGFALLD